MTREAVVKPVKSCLQNQSVKESFEMCCSGKHVLLSNILNVRTIYEKLWQSSSDQSKHKEGAASSLWLILPGDTQNLQEPLANSYSG